MELGGDWHKSVICLKFGDFGARTSQGKWLLALLAMETAKQLVSAGPVEPASFEQGPTDYVTKH